MKFKFKNAIYSLLVLIAIPLVLALFTDKEYNVEDEIVIEQPKTVVFEYIKSLRNQNKFSKLANIDPNIDPNMIQTYSGKDKTVGFISAWESDHPEVGKG
jgi:hypothetical protein